MISLGDQKPTTIDYTSSSSTTVVSSCESYPLVKKVDAMTYESPDGKQFTTKDGITFLGKMTNGIGVSDGNILTIDGTIYRLPGCSSGSLTTGKGNSEGQKLATNFVAVFLAALLILSNWFY